MSKKVTQIETAQRELEYSKVLMEKYKDEVRELKGQVQHSLVIQHELDHTKIKLLEQNDQISDLMLKLSNFKSNESEIISQKQSFIELRLANDRAGCLLDDEQKARAADITSKQELLMQI